MGQQLIFTNVTFKYESMTEPLLEGVNLHFSQGWTSVAGINGSGKTTLLKLAAGLLVPLEGSIHFPDDAVIFCTQRTDRAPEGFDDFLTAYDKNSCRLRGLLKIREDWLYRWDTLSHGERKKAQIGTALAAEPQVLIVDEPANHLDMGTREMLLSALELFKGTGIMVSHDRGMIDRLCYQSVFINPPEAVCRPGGFTKGKEQENVEQQSARKELSLQHKELKRLEREARRRKKIEESSMKRRSKKGLAIKDHDGRAKRNLARLTGKDGVGGKLMAQMESRLGAVENKISSIKVRKEYEVKVWLETEYAKKDYLFRLPEDRIIHDDSFLLEYPELVMQPKDRIALTGDNGSGKSSLVGRIVKSLTIPMEKVIYIPQEIKRCEGAALLEQVKALPKEKLGTVMTAVNCLGSRPARLLESPEPSPGETRKLLLALGISKKPYLIIMDEPTNHMDALSIDCLEEVLGQCPCGLLLVSHEKQLVKKLARKLWHSAEKSPGEKGEFSITCSIAGE